MTSRKRPATRAQECELFVGVHTGAEVDVVGAKRDAREFRVGVGVFNGEAAAGQHAGASAVDAPLQTRRRSAQRLGPRRRDEVAVAVANQRCVEAVGARWRS